MTEDALFPDINRLYSAGRYAEALPLAERLVTSRPGAAEAHHILGSILLQLDRHGEALAQFEQAARGAAHPVIAANRARALCGLGRRDEAIAILVEARRRAPSDIMLIDLLTMLHVEATRALQDQRQRLAPQDPGGSLKLGSAWRRHGQAVEALAAHRRALALSPSDQDARREVIYGNRALFAALHLSGRGIEIGAFANPVRLPPGVAVRYVDAYDTAELYRRFPAQPANSLVRVDLVDDGETLASFPDASEDFIIANHMIEHCEDPIGTLASMLRVVRPGGVIVMAAPDKRHTYDGVRPMTPFDHLLRDHREGGRVSRSAHFEEWARLVKQVPDDQLAGAVRALQETPDMVHYHVWDHPAFIEFLLRARRECGLAFELAEACANGNYESLVVLTRTTATAA